MKITTPDKPPTVSGTLVLKVSGKRIIKTITVPTGKTDLGILLPAFQELTDLIVAATGESLEAKGALLTCTKGCGACCRQLVPLTHSEAKSVLDLIARMPERRRRLTLEKFKICREKLSRAGLYEKIKTIGHRSKEERVALGLEYFGLQLPCPFLEAEACSIYEARPLACREYLVTSPASHCANPTRDSIQCVGLPIKLSIALAKMEAALLTREVRWTTLTAIHHLALEGPDKITKTGVDFVNLLLEYIRSHAPPTDSP